MDETRVHVTRGDQSLLLKQQDVTVARLARIFKVCVINDSYVISHCHALATVPVRWHKRVSKLLILHVF